MSVAIPAAAPALATAVIPAVLIVAAVRNLRRRHDHEKLVPAGAALEYRGSPGAANAEQRKGSRLHPALQAGALIC